MVLSGYESEADNSEMTALTAFERHIRPAAVQCELCERPAWASTPLGMRCQDHALSEVEEAISENRCDWVPRIIRWSRKAR